MRARARRRAFTCARACVRVRVTRTAGLIVLCTITTYCTNYKKPKNLNKGGRNAPPPPEKKAVSAQGVERVKPMYSPKPPYI